MRMYCGAAGGKQLTRSNQPTVGLLDLPTEILEKIIGYVNIVQHPNIRMASRRLRDVDDLYVKQTFRIVLEDCIKSNPKSLQSISLQSVFRATEVYAKAGYESPFWGSILPMLRNYYLNHFTPSTYKVNKFLLHFYNLIENMFGDEDLQKLELLHIVTLIRFLKDFQRIDVEITVDTRYHLLATLQIHGPWLGVLWTPQHIKFNHIVKAKNLLTILSEVYVSNKISQESKRVWEHNKDVYVFGNNIDDIRGLPSVLFTFKIYGSTAICSLLRSILLHNVDDFVWPEEWPKDNFNITVEIICNKASKWGCSNVLAMFIGSNLQADCDITDSYESLVYQSSSDLPLSML